MLRGIFLLFLLNISVFNANAFVDKVNKKFKIYHSLGHKGKPDLYESYGIQYLKIYGHSHFWNKNENDENIPNTKNIQRLANENIKNNDKFVCFDIEHWPVTNVPLSKVKESIKKYIGVINVYKKIAKEVKVGYYGTLPIRNYWAPVRSGDKKSVEFALWETENLELHKIAAKVDVIMPSLYTFYNRPKDWVKYAKAMLIEAKKYNKPVYAFIWPEYHGSNFLLSRSEIDEKFWLTQLRTIYKYADGVIIWSLKMNPSIWNKESGWWKATETFMREINYDNFRVKKQSN